jgi:DNA-binding IclR family transcriptional regulator
VGESDVPSPPTDRVVAVLGLLLAAPSSLRISDVVDRLGINRSTCSAILETLELRGWVERLADRSYQPGGGLIPIANAVRSRLPILARAEPVMKRLMDELGVEAIGLSLIDGAHQSRVARVGTPTGPEAGPLFEMPLFPPFGAVVAAFEPDREQVRWLDQVSDPAVRNHLRSLLESVRHYGAAVWRFDAQTQFISEAIFASQSLMSRLTAGQNDDERGRLPSLLHDLARLGYLSGDLRAKRALSVAYLEAPIFAADGRTCYQLEVHVLRDAVSKNELRTILIQLRAAADELTLVCGGKPASFSRL